MKGSALWGLDPIIWAITGVRKFINLHKGRGGSVPPSPPPPRDGGAAAVAGGGGPFWWPSGSIQAWFLRVVLKQKIPDSLCIPAGSWSRLELRSHHSVVFSLSQSCLGSSETMAQHSSPLLSARDSRD